MTLRVAVVGAGPAGIYAADILTKSEADVSVDLIERLPAPFGLVRYGVAPDHPRIKEIIKALQRIIAKPEVRLLANVDLGRDIITDFSFISDSLSLDSSAWGGATLSREQILDFARQTPDGVLFEFGLGNTLLLEGAALAQLANLDLTWF